MLSISREHVEEGLTKLKVGSILIQRERDGGKSSRYFYLDQYERFISYRQSEGSFKINKPPRYYIRQIDEIRSGFNSRTFERLLRHKLVEASDDEKAFSIFYNNYRDEIHLIANDKQTKDLWVQYLQYLIEEYQQRQEQYAVNETNWIMNCFYWADKDGSGSLTRKECRSLVKDLLNAKMSEADFEKLFQEADKSGEGLLTSDEFVDFFHVITRRKDLYKLMQQYVKDGQNQSIDTITMDVDELLYFLRNVQNQTVIKNPTKDSFSLELISTREQVQELINQFEPNIQLQNKGQLSLDGFRNLLLANDFRLMKPWCSRYVYQDMTRPLSDYYIKTSHNTYLFNTQVAGDSNPEAYNRALHAGARAVEIDCYDGDNGRPIVKHGFTLVRPCLFESIIRFMEPNLFKNSPYPVILDLENHCSIKQQYEMVRILQRILGDRLLKEPLLTNDLSILPSPEDLKYKVLIRGVKVEPPITIPKILPSNKNDETTDDVDNTSSTKTLTNRLGDLIVYLQNVSLHDYLHGDDENRCVQSANLAEKHFDQAAQKDPIGLIKKTLKSSFRMYPDGLRQDSSNPNPIYPWNYGIQMVALNYQYDDPMMALSYGKFSDNGGCGYVLKPKYLIDIEKTNFNPLNYLNKPSLMPKTIGEQPQRLTIKIISAHFLPRASKNTSDVPDPYVIVSTHGITCDQQTQKTKTIMDNGFNPEWNETFTFDIHFPQMCLVRFDVYDYDRFTKDDRLTFFCLPMTTMQTGYRHILLKARNNSLTYSTLFIHVAIENI